MEYLTIMTMKTLYNILPIIQQQEKKTSSEHLNPIDEAAQMITYLQDLLSSTKLSVLENGFRNESEEIHFFRNIKPQILGKLIFHNKVFRIETACPFPDGKMHYKYFSDQLKEVKQKFSEYIDNSDFYRYYRSGRTDKDNIYFTLGNINYSAGLNSFVFEIDTEFSTYYDNIVAQIIAHESLYSYLVSKVNPENGHDLVLPPTETRDIFWTGSKNALIELIYALLASGAISHGKIGIRKISLVFQTLFHIQLGDIHHAFHRMKVRSGSRTAFLDQLKDALEKYMEKDL